MPTCTLSIQMQARNYGYCRDLVRFGDVFTKRRDSVVCSPNLYHFHNSLPLNSQHQTRWLNQLAASWFNSCVDFDQAHHAILCGLVRDVFPEVNVVGMLASSDDVATPFNATCALCTPPLTFLKCAQCAQECNLQFADALDSD
jgi:hypothetical protein